MAGISGKDYFQELGKNPPHPYQRAKNLFADYRTYSRNAVLIIIKILKRQKEFFATIQNKFHFAITGKKPLPRLFMKKPTQGKKNGAFVLENSPKGRIFKNRIRLSQNYLEETEIKKIERTVSSYFDYIERMIEARTAFTMEKLAESINKFCNLINLKF